MPHSYDQSTGLAVDIFFPRLIHAITIIIKIMVRNIPDIHEFASQNKVSLRQVMDFTTMANPLGPAARAKSAIRKNLKNLECRPDGKTGHFLRLIARSENIPEKNILPCAGFPGLVVSTLKAFRAEKVLVPVLYPSYYREFLSGGQFLFGTYPDGDDPFSNCLDGLIGTMPEYDAVILPYPSFVASSLPPREKLIQVISASEATGTILIIDETLREYARQPSLADEALQTKRCFVFRSMGEYYALAGLPVAYAIGSKEGIEQIRQGEFVTQPDAFACRASMASLQDRAYGKRTGSFMRLERAFIEEKLRRIDGISFSSTVCGSFIISIEKRSPKMMETFARYGIIVDELIAAGGGSTLFMPVKRHKWNARYLKTLRNIMEAAGN